MKRFILPVGCLTLFLALALAVPAVAQDTNAAPGGTAGQPDAAALAAMAQLTQPGENHKIFAQTVGDWTYVIKFWMNPDTNAPPLVSTGASSTKAIMGGRYFVTDTSGKMSMPGPDGKLTDVDFIGQEIAGYDNVKRKYVSSWIDNMGTGIMHMEGTYDPTAKALTYRGEEEEVPGVINQVREVITFTDPDHHLMEYYMEQGGHETKAMEVTYTRVAH